MFEEILNLKRPCQLPQTVLSTIEKTINIAIDGANHQNKGFRLAAAFDLLASIEYYHSVTNRGWTYCPESQPKLLYPYTNTCPRCIANGVFSFTKANKPESGQIGIVTTELLCTMLDLIFKKKGHNIEVYKASEPIDAIIYDKDKSKLLIAEIKSAPMMAIPLVIECERMTESIDGEIIYTEHSTVDNPAVKKSDIGMFLPKVSNMPEKIVSLTIDWNKPKPFYSALNTLYMRDNSFFDRFYRYWKIAYDAYANKDKDCALFWLTNGCGQPVPRPNDWPARKGTGYESVSDAKTSVGMDRTDDIKKAIYQVLKLGAEYKPNDESIKTAIISNIHAVRHYGEYLLSVRDVIWSLDKSCSVTRAQQLDPNTPIYNLFDGILSFTRSEIRDAWIADIFDFGD